MKTRSTLEFFLNDKKISIPSDKICIETTLLQYLQNNGITGTKEGCGEGGCGACTVTISEYIHSKKKAKHFSVTSCLFPLLLCDGKLITTVEKVGSVRKGKVNPIQERFGGMFSTQCGYCTPGFIMSLWSKFQEESDHEKIKMHDIEEAISGNLCRCTGYRPILESMKSFGSDFKEDDFSIMCKKSGKYCKSKIEGLLFPKELTVMTGPLHYTNGKQKWFAPKEYKSFLTLLKTDKDDNMKIIAGNTEIGFERLYHHSSHDIYISTNHVKELKVVLQGDNGITIGSSITLTDFGSVLKKSVKKYPAHQTAGYRAILKTLEFFANPHVRNFGTLGGTLCNADPLSDLFPLLTSLNVILKIESTDGVREVPMHKFILGENKVDLKKNEVLLSLFIPFTQKNVFIRSYKVAKRKMDDQAQANGGFNVTLDESNVVKNIVLCFGGVNKKPTIRSDKLEKFIIGKTWNEKMFWSALKILTEESDSLVNMRRGNKYYKRTLLNSLFYKFFVYVSNMINGTFEDVQLEEKYLKKKYTQSFPERSEKVVGKSKSHLDNLLHTTGEAIYTAEIEFPKTGLFAAPVLSKKPHAKIISIDTSKALELEGVEGFVYHKDIPGSNLHGSIVHDEEVFASKKVNYFGHLIGLICAKNRKVARKAARLVKITYEELPFIFSIKEAIEKKSFFESEHPKVLKRGDTEKAFKECVKNGGRIIENEVFMGGQDHFYIENTCALAFPRNGDSVEIVVPTQNPSLVQQSVARALGISQNKVITRVERIGGGFGGKQDRPLFLGCAVAIAARKFGVPISLILSREEDMQITGQRHEFLGRYKIGVDTNGKIVALNVQLWNNAGHSLDLSHAVMEVAMFTIDGCYYLPNYNIVGKTCKTNRVSCTAFRGFGKPQGCAIMETIMDQVAFELSIEPVTLRKKNLLKKGNNLLEHQLVLNDNISVCFSELEKIYKNLRKEVNIFNEKNKLKKRGLALCPIKANACFETDLMNQASALVHIYNDGSIMVCHGGVEMGQGIHTKMAQIVAEEFGIALDEVIVSETSTEKNPNTFPTAAVSGTDLNGRAVVDACQKIKKRLIEFESTLGLKKKLPFKELINKAYLNKINLSQNGFGKLKNFAYNWLTKKGAYSYYFIWSSSLSLVELDILTGEYQILRNDIIQDVGLSINPGIDVGQIEGGFAQGLGLYSLEELIWATYDAHLRSRNVSTYKIPSLMDVPRRWNIKFLKGSNNKRGIYSSKACGESGVSCAISVVIAIRDALYSAQKKKKYIHMNFPVTVEKIRMALDDDFVVKKVK